MNIYIAGPMRGYAEFNFPAFFKAEENLTEQGWTCFNPARDDEEHYDDFSENKGFAEGDVELAESDGFSLREALKRDTTWICDEADAIYMLRGWQQSKGACAEKALSEALGLEVFYE